MILNPTEATVFVIDDDEQARESVCALIRSKNMHAVAYPSGESFLDAYDGLVTNGCVVTDLQMDGMNGLELQDQLLKRGIALPVIVITAYPRTSSTVQAMKHGAVTLLEKPYDDDNLWDAIEEAIRQSGQLQNQRIQRHEVARRIETLSEKERVVMDFIVDGVANKVIAKKLDVSVRTVESRRHAVFEKMQAGSLAELVRMAVSVSSTRVEC